MACLPDVISGTRKIRSTKRRSGRSQRKTKTRAGRHVTPHFLNQTFEPVTSLVLPKQCSINSVECSFFDSVKHFCDLYRFPIPAVPDVAFPVNIFFIFGQLREVLDKTGSHLQILITGCVENPLIATAKILNTDYNLYYVPLQPLQKLLSIKRTKPLGDLVLSACHILYHKGLTLCDGNSFIGYEMMLVRDSIDDYADEIEPQEMEDRKQEADNIISHCERLCKRMASKQNDDSFAARLQKVRTANVTEQKLIEAVHQIQKLQSDFPKRQFSDQIIPIDRHDGEAGTMFPDQYLSFYWGGTSVFDDQLADWIDCHLQEMNETQAPIALQLFDRPHKTPTHNLAFETRFLACITQLNTALYELSH